MAHFARISEDNIVTQVIVINNNDIIINGSESEAKGIEFCKQLLGQDTNWVQTSYNGKIRKNFAGIGYTYDKVKDAFIAPKPISEDTEEVFTLNDNFQWITNKPKAI